MEEFGLLGDVAFAWYIAGYVELLADDLTEAETSLRRAREGEEMYLDAQVVLALGEVLYRQARYEEAFELVEKFQGSVSHLSDHVGLTSIKARLLAQSGRLDEAEAVARDAVVRGSESDYLLMRGDSLLALGEVLVIAGRLDEGADAAREALQLFDQKGSTVFRTRALSLLDAIS
jgi:tetratricopeptide (TPR) repeat protein